MRLAAHLAPTLALVACGGSGGDRWSNSLHTPRTTLVDVGAPHVPIILYTRAGLSRIYVDNASHEAVAGSDKAIALDADATLDIEAGHYVVNRRGAAKLVIEGVTPQSYVDVAPDRKHIALTEEHTVVIASLADGTVRRFDVPAGPARDQHLGMHWAPTSDAVIVDYDTSASLDIVTGALTPLAKADEMQWLERPSPGLACQTKGFVLEERQQNHEQQIVLLPTASTTNPEQLSSLETRVLVRATDKSGHSGDGAINLGKKNPEPLSLDAVLPSCEHFLFSLEGKTFVGNIATGKIAFVAFGWGAVL